MLITFIYSWYKVVVVNYYVVITYSNYYEYQSEPKTEMYTERTLGLGIISCDLSIMEFLAEPTCDSARVCDRGTRLSRPTNVQAATINVIASSIKAIV